MPPPPPHFSLWFPSVSLQASQAGLAPWSRCHSRLGRCHRGVGGIQRGAGSKGQKDVTIEKNSSQFTTGENSDNWRSCKGTGRPGVQHEQSSVICRELKKMCAKGRKQKVPTCGSVLCLCFFWNCRLRFEPWLLFDVLASLLGRAITSRELDNVDWPRAAACFKKAQVGLSMEPQSPSCEVCPTSWARTAGVVPPSGLTTLCHDFIWFYHV